MKMIFKVLSIALAITILSGCNGQRKKTATGEKVNDKELTSQADKQKTTLIKQIDKKYDNGKAHYELGKLYQQEGQWDKAEWEYDKALAFNPVHHEAQASMVKLLVDKGDTQKSSVIADMYINQASIGAKNSLLLGRAFQDRGLDEYALTSYMQAHRLAPNSVVINKQLGYFYLLKKDNANAEIYLRRAFELNPYQPEVAGQLGKLGVQVEIPKKAQKGLKKFEKEKTVPGQAQQQEELK